MKSTEKNKISETEIFIYSNPIEVHFFFYFLYDYKLN